MKSGLSGLIGHTGFVGSNLSRQYAFDHQFNSSNCEQMAGRRFDLLVCAGVSASKWLANQDPEADRDKIAVLEHALRSVEAERFILISTVDVYPATTGVDEASDCHSAANHAYGRNRLAFEEFVKQRFREVHVVRLSGLFGPGLKKNVIFDLMNDNCLEVINVDSSIQWYDVAGLWRDVTVALNNEIHLVNLVNEPVKTSRIVQRVFPGKQVGAASGPAVSYDVRSRHADLFGGAHGHLLTRDQVLGQIGSFVAMRAAGNQA